jgi:hypothetical protein
LQHVGGHYHLVTGEPVSDDSAEQQENDHGCERGGRDIPNVADRATDGQDGERDGHDRQGGPGDGDHVAGQQ